MKRDSSSKLEKDRSTIADLNLEISRLKSQLEDASAKFDGEKSIVEDSLRREKQSKSEMEGTMSCSFKKSLQMQPISRIFLLANLFPFFF